MATEQAVQPRGARPRGRARERVEENVVEAVPSVEERSLSGEVVGARVTPIEWVLYSAFTVVGAVMRFWDLGSRALLHDESLHATYSAYLWAYLTGHVVAGNASPEYHYDPMMHGPYQFHGNALMYLIFGVSNASARYNAALCGTALIILPFLLRRQLGRAAALILSALLAFSPAFLYYSRLTREDIYFALWTAVFFVGLIRWLDARGRPKGHRWLYMAAAGFALSWATKESAIFTLAIVAGFIAAIFAVGYAYQFLAPRRARGAQAKGRSGAPAEHPVVAALGDFARANLPPLVKALRGTPRRGWLGSLGIMAVIIVVLYWPIGDPWQWGFIPGAHTQPTTNAAGQTVYYNTDFLTGGLSYWILQQGVARGSQPWYYYFLVIPLYEQVAVVFGAAGLVYYFLHRRTRLAEICGAAFVVLALLTLFVGPNLPKPLHYLLALAMIASGVALLVSRPRSLILNLLLWWTVTTWGIYTWAAEKMPWLTLHILLPTFFVAALYLGHLFQAPRFSRKWLLTAVLLALTAIVSFRSSVALAYVDGANPTEMLIYTQTAPDVANEALVFNRIPAQTLTTGGQGHVCVDNEDEWPWVWYLRNDPTDHCWAATEDDLVTHAQERFPVIIIGGDKYDSMSRDGKLAQFANYTVYKFRFNWWFPEDYKDWETTGIGGFLGQVLQPSQWLKLVNWWATRTPFDQQAFDTWSNARRSYVYVRDDLVRQYIPASWAAAHAKALHDAVVPVTASDDVAPALTRPAAPSFTLTGLPQPLNAPHALAFDAAGNLYVTDPVDQRVVKLDRNGHYLTAWGAVGSGNGQFSNQFNSDPMGIAVGHNGDVYVADTWNQRIQEFTPTGAFVRAFGGGPNPSNGTPTADSFYGPRQIAVAPNGNLYIADTGNKRIQVYSPTGQHLFNIGTGATSAPAIGQPGSFDEPSGVAVDSHGIVYVADYWNRRVQRFTLDGKLLGTYQVAGWPHAGWPAVEDYNEPYLAVDNQGHLFATDAPTIDAHVNHVLELDAATGRVLRAFGDTTTAGALASPSGVALGPDGSLYIADDGAMPRIARVQP